MATADMLQVPFLDLKRQNENLCDELTAALDGVIDNAQFILGPAVARFEAAFAAYLGAKHCVGLNNGTSALHMALIGCDIGPGDEVITTPNTWISTTWAVSYVGARPVYVDIDPVTYNLDPAKVEAAITPRTKAILPVHLYGQSCDLTALERIAARYGLALIEDTAQAHGATWAGRRCGTVGRVGCFSFYPGKNLGAFGEGGAIVTNDEAVARRIRCLRDHAQDGRHHHVEIGFNTRMEGIQGAVLEVKLRHLDRWNDARRRAAQRYHELLAGTPGFQLPAMPDDPAAHVWHLFVVLSDTLPRDEVLRQLAARGVSGGVHYPTPVPFQPAYAHLGYNRGDFPVAEDVMGRCFSLPMCAELSDEQIEYVAEAVRSLGSPAWA